VYFLDTLLTLHCCFILWGHINEQEVEELMLHFPKKLLYKIHGKVVLEKVLLYDPV